MTKFTFAILTTLLCAAAFLVRPVQTRTTLPYVERSTDGRTIASPVLTRIAQAIVMLKPRTKEEETLLADIASQTHDLHEDIYLWKLSLGNEPNPDYVDSLTAIADAIDTVSSLKGPQRLAVLKFLAKDISVKARDCAHHEGPREVQVDVNTIKGGQNDCQWTVYSLWQPPNSVLLKSRPLAFDTLSSPAHKAVVPGVYVFYAVKNGVKSAEETLAVETHKSDTLTIQITVP